MGKSYDGENWDFEFVSESELPEQLLLNILGNRKPVIFVEGNNGSYDKKLYEEIYQDYYIVPSEGCSTVIERTKAMRKMGNLHHLDCFGIIDRDYRSEIELEKLAENGVYSLQVAEVENLFIVEELMKIVNEIMGFKDYKKVEEAKKYIIEKRFKDQVEGQIINAITAEIKYQLSVAAIRGKTEEQLEKSFEKSFKEISFDEIKKEKTKLFKEALTKKDYRQVLKLFNEKSLVSNVGQFFDVEKNRYSELVLRQLSGKYRNEMIEAVADYLPSQVPLQVIAELSPQHFGS